MKKSYSTPTSMRANAPYRRMSYMEVRQLLWPADRFPRWIPWSKPKWDREFDTLLDDEIAQLIKSDHPPRLKPRSELQPLTAGTPHTFLNSIGEIDVFCPYREVRAHWIPLAVQVARFEADRHLRRIETGADPTKTIKVILEALDLYCRYEPEILAGIDRPLLARWVSKPRGKPTPDGRPGPTAGVWTEWKSLPGVRFGPVEVLDPIEAIKPLPEGNGKNYLRTYYAREAQLAAAAALKAIALSHDLRQENGPSLKVFRKEAAEWETAFAAVLGFAWRRLTGRNPSSSPASTFAVFVKRAHETIAPTMKISWERACRNACDRYGEFFETADRDATLLVAAEEVWSEILPRPRDNWKVTDLGPEEPSAVIDRPLP